MGSGSGSAGETKRGVERTVFALEEAEELWREVVPKKKTMLREVDRVMNTVLTRIAPKRCVTRLTRLYRNGLCRSGGRHCSIPIHAYEKMFVRNCAIGTYLDVLPETDEFVEANGPAAIGVLQCE